jgi:hypothetical protein
MPLLGSWSALMFNWTDVALVVLALIVLGVCYAAIRVLIDTEISDT